MGVYLVHGKRLSITSPERSAPLAFHVVHAIAGRVRFRVDAPHIFEHFTASFQSFLRSHEDILDVHMNRHCHSVVVCYVPTALSTDAVAKILASASVDQLRSFESTPNQSPPPAISATPPWMSLVFSTATVALELVESWFTPWLLALASVPIFSRAFEAMTRKGELNVDVLDAAATAVLTLRGHLPAAATMVWLVALGDTIRDITMQQSQRALEGLLQAEVACGWVIRKGRTVAVKVQDIRAGEEVVVYPGELIPVDGLVLRGTAIVDQKLLTGESTPVQKRQGDTVYAATVLREGTLYVRTAQVGQETAAAKMVQLVHEAPIHDTRIQNYAERFANRLVPWSFLGAGISFLIQGNANTAASLLIIDYGTGIRVSAPTTVLSAMTRAARRGIFIKGGRYLERLAAVDTIIFDKTGTLTIGSPEIEEVIPYGEIDINGVLALAASAEDRLTHPIAEAIVRLAKRRHLHIPVRDRSEYHVGLGVEASIQGETIHVGGERLMALRGISDACAYHDCLRTNGRAISRICVARNGKLIGLLVVRHPLRPEAPQVLQRLHELGIQDVIMLTGDNEAVAQRIASQMGIRRYVAEALPKHKLDCVKSLQAEGHTVAVVGDGINDSPALAQADVGIAVRGGADVAKETAGISLLEDDLWKVPEAIEIARQAVRLIEQNWRLIAYPNSTAIVLSVLNLIGPIGATLISNGSAIAATLNGLRPLFHRSPGKAHRRAHSKKH